MLVICIGLVRGNCTKHHINFCNIPDDILHFIKGYPDNYQQLLNAVYPINQAKPSSVIIAYFTNYTDPLPEECSLGTYLWEMYPMVNIIYQFIDHQMWTTTAIYTIAAEMKILIEFAEYPPILSYYFILNKTSPFMLSTPIACIKIPFYLRNHWTGDYYVILGIVTTKVSRYFNSVTDINNHTDQLEVKCYNYKSVLYTGEYSR